MRRNAAHDAFASLVDFGRVIASELSGSAKNLLATLQGAEGEGAERVENQQVWGHAAILWRPVANTEVLFLRNGDELLTVASRETRWQVDLAEGDVVIRNLNGSTPVRLTLKSDGNCVLEADLIKLGDSGATEAIGLGTAIKGHLDSLKTHLDTLQTVLGTHTHAGVTVGPGVTGVSAAVFPTPPTVPDVESRHKVEN